MQWKARQGKTYFLFTLFLLIVTIVFVMSPCTSIVHCSTSGTKVRLHKNNDDLSMLHDTFRKNADLSNKHPAELHFSECVSWGIQISGFYAVVDVSVLENELTWGPKTQQDVLGSGVTFLGSSFVNASTTES